MLEFGTIHNLSLQIKTNEKRSDRNLLSRQNTFHIAQSNMTEQQGIFDVPHLSYSYLHTDVSPPASTTVRSQVKPQCIPALQSRRLVRVCHSPGSKSPTPSSLIAIANSQIPNTRRRPKPCEKFQFSHIFGDDSASSEVFQTTCAPLVERLVKGKDSLLFTLGVTGSGKVLSVYAVADETHTVFGESANPGIIPLSLKGLFEAIATQRATVRGTLYRRLISA
jgi:Kinesin motor domain